MSSATSAVLLSWVATNNDPYERERGSREYVRRGGEPVAGPSLTLLADESSSYRGRITTAVFFRQQSHKRTYEDLVEVLAETVPNLELHEEVFDQEDPTDHTAIFEFLREALPRIRRKFRDRELVVHLSPGTPAMQTVWVLMAETGFIQPPFTVVQSYRAVDRRERPTVIPVRLGIDTFYKRYQESRPGGADTAERSVGWQPRFESPRSAAVYREARRLAGLKVPVLILGERGTGKTQLAGWIRQWSRWRKPECDRNWPAIACGQYTPETMRAELFGHSKGAFTDAKEARPGLLKHAHKDTLFLDEIGDISRELQRLLIKALEERQFQPLGSTTVEESDFRLLSATNLSLTALRARLDADFMDRISPFVLRVPALREIPEDIGWQWDEVLEAAARRAEVDLRYAKMAEPHRQRVLAALRAHPLPGNLRDLFRVAWRFLAARADDQAPLTVADAVDDALTALASEAEPASDNARTFARAFADCSTLPTQLVEHGPLDPKEVWDEQRNWLAREVDRISHERRVRPESLVSVDERTLRSWRKK